MVANEVAKFRREHSNQYWSHDGSVCRVRLEDFAACNLAQRLCSSSERPLKFTSTVNRRKYSLCGFTDEPIDEYYFKDTHSDGSGDLVSVSAWSERTYGVKIKYGHLPGIETV